ncbi:hypothetical protein BMM12_002119 [Escherichia coli]|nr:hypothetical protein [Escherichia coli]EEV0658340.1 hypothetical protein [Escherichia coli]EEV9929969.1 hypothetical protein [Escherichia coli]EEW0082074.1 hypothetical protein [Escherichia coli]EEX4735339.1 hypothetical protein [Escherichia coli]
MQHTGKSRAHLLKCGIPLTVTVRATKQRYNLHAVAVGLSQASTTVKSSVKNHALLALNRIFQASGTGCGEYEYAGGILS